MPQEPTLELPLPRLSEGRFASVAALTDDALAAACGVRIAFCTREGGASTGPYESLNIGTNTDDDPELVARNMRTVREAFGVAEGRQIRPWQVHGDNVLACDRPEQAPLIDEQAQEGCDGVVVRCCGVSALLGFADCAPVIIVAPTGQFAVVHAGWRGVVNRVSEKAVAVLAQGGAGEPDTYNAYIGPHIRACHFEVGPEVAERFHEGFGAGTLADERHVSMADALRVSLTRAGLHTERICDAGICTVDNDRFFSYRRSGGTCGRHGAIAVRHV